MTESPSRPPVAALVWGVIVPLLFWACFFAGLLIVVPHYQKRYLELGLNLPYSTQVAIDTAAWANTYWYVLLIWLLIFLPSGTLIAVALGRRSGRGLTWLWCGAMIALPLVASAVLVLAIYAAKARLLEGLSR